MWSSIFIWKRKKVKNAISFFVTYDFSYKSSKQALNDGLILKKVHRVIQVNQKEWLEPYIKLNTELRKQSKRSFWKTFFQTNE